MRARFSLGVAIAAAAVGGVAIVGAPARADDLADARKLAATLDYDRALAVVEHALAAGGNDPARVVELHLLAGQLAAGLDRAEVAEDHFARALAVRPDAALAADVSPKLRAPFDAARAHHRRPLRVHGELVRGLARVAVDDDDLGLVTGIAVDAVDASGAHAELVARDRPRIAIPPGDTAVEISALDAGGNRLWIGPFTAAASAAAPSAATSAAESPRWYARWSTWAIVCGAAAATGAVLGWRMTVAQDDWNTLRAADGLHDYSELAAVESRGRSYAIGADIGLGVAIGAGITATILELAHREPAPTSSSTSVAAPAVAFTLDAGHVGLSVGATF